jgi:hypothetical protein
MDKFNARNVAAAGGRVTHLSACVGLQFMVGRASSRAGLGATKGSEAGSSGASAASPARKSSTLNETLQKERSGFRQKAALFNFQSFAALCRDAATILKIHFAFVIRFGQNDFTV